MSERKMARCIPGEVLQEEFLAAPLGMSSIGWRSIFTSIPAASTRLSPASGA